VWSCSHRIVRLQTAEKPRLSSGVKSPIAREIATLALAELGNLAAASIPSQSLRSPPFSKIGKVYWVGKE
jgi:hypothetical protein